MAILVGLSAGVGLPALVGDGAAVARSARSMQEPASPPDILEAVSAFLNDVEQAARTGDDLATFDARLEILRRDRPWLEWRRVDYAEAWLRHRQGRDEAAAALLEPLVGAQHHTVPIDPRFHIALAQTYAALGRQAAAQSQWRLALASIDEAEVSIRETWLREALADAVAAHPVALVPDAGLSAGVQLINLGSIVRERKVARYEAAYFEPRDLSDGKAYWLSLYSLDCATFETTVLERQYFGADGRRLDAEASGRSFRPANVLAYHVAKMVCSTPLEGIEHTPMADYLALFQDYRAWVAQTET